MYTKNEVDTLIKELEVLVDPNKPKHPNTDFITRLYNFDWYYGYTDDGNVYRARFEEQIKLKEESKQFGLEFVFSKSDDERNEWFRQQPCIKDMLRKSEIKSIPVIKFMLQGYNFGQWVSMNDGINYFMELFNKLPEYSNGYFVHTPKTPNLREYFKRTGESGITLPESLQHEFTNLFQTPSVFLHAFKLAVDSGHYIKYNNIPVMICYNEISETSSRVLRVSQYPRQYQFVI